MTSKDHQLTNAWESGQAMDDARRRAERDAFEKVLGEFEASWPVIVARYERVVAEH